MKSSLLKPRFFTVLFLLVNLFCLISTFAQTVNTTAASPNDSIASTLPPPIVKGIIEDSLGRVSWASNKKQVPCPKQDERTAVILVIGQSNAANYATDGYQSRYGNAVLNMYEGNCYAASSPLLGATGPWGEYWTEVANRLVAAHVYRRVIIASSAIGGSQVAQWQTGGRLNTMLQDVISKVQTKYVITHVLWHQGESDYFTSKEDYTRSFLSLVSSLRAHGVSAPIYVSVNSGTQEKDLPVVQAQRELPDISKGIYAGVDTDALVEDKDRNVTGHFGPEAEKKVIKAWVNLLRKNSEVVPAEKRD